MGLTDRIVDGANKSVEEFMLSPTVRLLQERAFTRAHYSSCLREIYHYVRENAGLQMLAAARLRGPGRRIFKKFCKHAVSEIGHEELAVKDLLALDYDVSQLRYENPLPTTVALNAFPLWQITYRNPVGYLGCLLFLEWLPTHGGNAMMGMLREVGIPDHAMSFLADHAEIDVAHNALMREYLEVAVTTHAEAEAVLYCTRGMGSLYAAMLSGAVARADTGSLWGVDCAEGAAPRT